MVHRRKARGAIGRSAGTSRSLHPFASITASTSARSTHMLQAKRFHSIGTVLGESWRSRRLWSECQVAGFARFTSSMSSGSPSSVRLYSSRTKPSLWAVTRQPSRRAEGSARARSRRSHNGDSPLIAGG